MGPLPPRVPPNEKTLTVKMPQSVGSARPQPPHHQPPPSEGNSSPKQPTPPSSAPASSDAQTLGTSPTKMSQDAGELDEMEGDVDPLAKMRMHYIPDQSVLSALTELAVKEAYDPRHIENMKADYEGQHSSQEEQRSGQYDRPQSYHIVPSPPRVGLDNEEQLTGPTTEADASPSTEARLLAGSPQQGSPAAESTRPPRASTPALLEGLSADTTEDIESTDV